MACLGYDGQYDSIQFNKDTLTLKTRTCDIQDYWANVELGQLDQSNQRNVTWGRYRNHAWSILIISKRMRKPQMTIHTFIVYSCESRGPYNRLVTNVGDERCWRQHWDVGDGFGRFRRRHSLSFDTNVGHQHPKDINVNITDFELSREEIWKI